MIHWLISNGSISATWYTTKHWHIPNYCCWCVLSSLALTQFLKFSTSDSFSQSGSHLSIIDFCTKSQSTCNVQRVSTLSLTLFVRTKISCFLIFYYWFLGEHFSQIGLQNQPLRSSMKLAPVWNDLSWSQPVDRLSYNYPGYCIV